MWTLKKSNKQIQNGIWLDNEITAYNFNTNSYETVKVTKSKIENVDTNIKIGCMILQDMIHNKDYNILAGVLSYNMGGANVNKILKKHSEESGISRTDILANQNDCDWLKHRGIITVGDKDYVQHVISYMGSDIDTYVIKPNGERVNLSIKNYDVTRLHFVGVDMLSYLFDDRLDNLNDREFEEYMKFISNLCEREDCVGLSIHMLDVFRKN